MQANYRIDSEAHPVQIWIPAADCLELADSPMPARNPVQYRENKFHFLSTLDGVRGFSWWTWGSSSIRDFLSFIYYFFDIIN